MKYLVAVILFASFIAGLRADDFEEDLFADEVPDRHPYVQCKIDLYDCFKAGNSKIECLKKYKTCMAQLIPTIPPFVVACRDNLKKCLAGASGLLNKTRCFSAFSKCLINKGPSTVVMDAINDGEPDRHPYVQCKIDLYDCIRLGKKGKLECLEDYKNCMAVMIPTIPPSVAACKDNLKKCRASASGLLEEAKCFTEFAKCLVNLVPLPTLPPFVEICSNNLMQCLKDEPTLTTKGQCLTAYAKCIKNKGPAKVVLDVMEDMGHAQLEDFNGVLQCKKDFFQCVKEGKDMKKCAADYKACMEALIPAYVKQCYAEARECFGSANGVKEKIACLKKLRVCLKNGPPTAAPPVPSAV